jgi:hypothetical protein
MATHHVIIPEVVHEAPCPASRFRCPYLAGDCDHCPHVAMGQTEEADLSLQVNTSDLVDQINAWLATPSPLFGLNWEWVLLLGFGAYAISRRGGR